MSRRRVRALLMAAVLSCGISSVSFGQEDASAAFKAGKTAFEAGQFDKAREQFQTASQTDNKNPEVFLWLGKAQYQLGQVDAAITSWKKTTALAPEEPYAAQMLKALTGRTADADTAIAVINSMLADELWGPAIAAADRVLADRALTDSQRAKATTARAQGLLGAGRWADAMASANELLVKYPAAADKDEVRTIIGRSKLQAGGARQAEGLATLQEIVTNRPNTPAAAIAHYEMLAFRLDQGVEQANVDAMAKWLADHADHDRANAARRRLIDAHLALASRGGEPGRAAKLSTSDTAALEIAAQLFKRTVRAEEALGVTNRIVAHLNNHYAKNGAFAAARAGIDALLKNELPPSSRAVARRTQAQFATEL